MFYRTTLLVILSQEQKKRTIIFHICFRFGDCNFERPSKNILIVLWSSACVWNIHAVLLRISSFSLFYQKQLYWPGMWTHRLHRTQFVSPQWSYALIDIQQWSTTSSVVLLVLSFRRLSFPPYDKALYQSNVFLCYYCRQHVSHWEVFTDIIYKRPVCQELLFILYVKFLLYYILVSEFKH